MCLAVYLASPYPLLNAGRWEDTPTLSLKPLLEREAAIRVRFSHPHVYYVGSHTGCGCGFGAGDPANADSRQRTIADLVGLLSEAAGDAPFEILTCWEGDERKPVNTQLVIQLTELATRTDWTEERTFSTITRTG
jgi:hypothetical protein